MRKTKIVCTIGPACQSEEIIASMIRAGMNTARLNFSHGTHDEHHARIELIKKIRAELDMPIAIMLDTKGPEFRIKTFKNGKIDLKEGDTFAFTEKDVQGSNDRVRPAFPPVSVRLTPETAFLVVNGLLVFSEKLTQTMRSVGEVRAAN